MSAPNDIAIIVAYLAATGTALYTLVGTRIYYAMLPTGYDNTQPAIVFQRRSGSRDLYLDVAEPDMQFKCYGGSSSFADAETVYRALADRLHGAGNEVVTGGGIVVATETQMGQPIIDPATGWPYVLSFYQLAVRAA